MAVPKYLIRAVPCLKFLENRWLRLIIWPVVMMFSTLLYYGWTDMSQFLADADYLVNLCPQWMMDERGRIEEWRSLSQEAGDGSIFEDSWNAFFPNDEEHSFDNNAAGLFFCRDQQIVLTRGYTLASTGEFVFGFVAGIMFDEIGAFWTALTGACMFFLGWLCILAASTSEALYITGMFMQGASVNLVAFASFLLVDMFPKWPAVIFAVVLGGQVTCAGVMPILYSQFSDTGFKAVMAVYIYAICLPLVVVYLITMPFTRQDLVDEGLMECNNVLSRTVRWKSFGKQCCTVEFVTFSCWYVLSIMQYNYYNSILWDITAHWVSIGDTIGWMYLGQGVYAVVFGVVNDAIMTLPACALITISQVYMWGLLDPQKLELLWGSMLSGIFMVVFNAHVYSTKYCYVQEIYHKDNFGKLAGFIGLFAGVLQQFNSLIVSNKADELAVSAIYNLVNIVSFGLLGFLMHRQFRSKIQYNHGFLDGWNKDIPSPVSLSHEDPSVAAKLADSTSSSLSEELVEAI